MYVPVRRVVRCDDERVNWDVGVITCREGRERLSRAEGESIEAANEKDVAVHFTAH